jgi:hypothetical protein
LDDPKAICEFLRRSREHLSHVIVDHIAVSERQTRDLLLQIARLAVPLAGPAQTTTLTNAELETLAAVEHGRWLADHMIRGWRFGEKHDDMLMPHPDIRPYEALDEPANNVRVLLDVLRAQGWTIIRRSQEGSSGEEMKACSRARLS